HRKLSHRGQDRSGSYEILEAGAQARARRPLLARRYDGDRLSDFHGRFRAGGGVSKASGKNGRSRPGGGQGGVSSVGGCDYKPHPPPRIHHRARRERERMAHRGGAAPDRGHRSRAPGDLARHAGAPSPRIYDRAARDRHFHRGRERKQIDDDNGARGGAENTRALGAPFKPRLEGFLVVDAHSPSEAARFLPVGSASGEPLTGGYAVAPPFALPDHGMAVDEHVLDSDGVA